MYSDPADNDNPEPNGAPAPRVPARTPGRRAKKGSPKVLMIGAAVAVLVIVGYAVAVHVAGGYERGLRATVESAEAKLLEGDFDGAKKLVAEASGLIDSGRDKLSAEGRIELRKRTDAASRAVAIHEDARKALSEMAGDPTAKREHIEDLVRSASQNYPRQKKLHEALREMAAKALDEERRIGKAKVDEALSAVREAIRQDPFGDAGKKLSETEELLEEFSRALADESKDSSKKEVERLRELVALADEAKGKAEDYKGRPKERKEQITVLIGRLGEDEESKALADRLGRVVGEAQKEIDAEVAAKTKELEHTVRYVTGQDDRITYDPKKFDLENKIVPFEVAGRTVEFQADPSFSRWRMKIGDRNFDFRFNVIMI